MPLMWMRDGINYNPTLSRRQLGYALKDPPRTNMCKNPCFMMCLIVLDGWKELPKYGKVLILKEGHILGRNILQSIHLMLSGLKRGKRSSLALLSGSSFVSARA